MIRKPMFCAAVLELLAASAIVLPGVASAAPHHNRGLTIATTANPITAGQEIVIYGELKGFDNAHQWILLYHRINPAAQFTLIGRRRTNSAGYYEFIRADGVVMSNRNWFVVGPGHTHSRTIHERVASVLTLNAGQSAATGTTTTTTTTTETGTGTGTMTVSTGQPVQFTGTVMPNHPDQRVLLQAQNALAGNGWRTIASAITTADSSFTIEHSFRGAGVHTLRALMRADARNTPGQSTPLTLTVEQAQNPSFTINASAQVLPDGQTEMISGTLYAAGSSTTVAPNVPIVLYGRSPSGHLRVLTTGATDSLGNYRFSQVPLHNTVYAVRTASHPALWTARLYVGVQDTVSIAVSGMTIPIGDHVTVSGVVAPDHRGHVVNLQRQAPDGNWADVESSSLRWSSNYSFNYPLGGAGPVNLRVEIPGGPINVGGVSSTVTVTGAGVAPVATLPPAS
ncbi:MAG: hypothetical protein ACRDKL_01025 [Solirubrobacteraceae bacterium]